MATIEQRLSMSKIDASKMSNEEKFMTATGMTFYDAEKEKNEWYVPGGAAMATDEETVEAEEKKEELEPQAPEQEGEVKDTHLEEEPEMIEEPIAENPVQETVVPTEEEPIYQGGLDGDALPGSEFEVETVE